MTFEAFAWLLTPLLPALVALYFLKLKRAEVVVSSTFLWKRSLEDLHVNSPFQRLRRSLLLLLQLLILAALILAASRPMITGVGEPGASRILVIDRSASMNVVEKIDGDERSRLEIALEKALDLVETKAPEDRASIIAFAERAELVQPMTNDPAKLRAALSAVKPSSYPTNFLSALRTARSIAESTPDCEVTILSDGSFPELSKVAPELERLRLRFVPIGSARPNVGIAELAVDRDFTKEQKVEIFASVANGGASPVRTRLHVYHGRQLVDAVDLEIEPGRSASHVFDGSPYSSPDGARILRFELQDGGALPDDDRAWVRIDPPVPVELLVVGTDWFLERFIGVNRLFHARRVSMGTYRQLEKDGRLADDPADVVIFLGQAPTSAPDRPTLYLGCFPNVPELFADSDPDANPDAKPDADPNSGADADPDAAPRRTLEKVKGPTVVDWDRIHPVNDFVNFTDLLISESYVFPGSSHFRSIIDSERGSIAGALLLTPSGRPSVSALVLGFEVRNTNWPWLHSFPIFFSKALAWLGSSASGDARQRYRTGAPLVAQVTRLSPEASKTLVIRDPAGTEHAVLPNRAGEISFPDTAEVGLYELRADEDAPGVEAIAADGVLERFPVALLSFEESQIKPGAEIRVGSDVVAKELKVEETQDLWKLFACLALAVVMLEWWVYNRRMTI